MRIRDTYPANSSQACIDAAEQVTGKTVTLQIPDFKPEDSEIHVYMMSQIQGNSAGDNLVGADENGLLYQEVTDRTNIPSADPDEEQPQYYFTSVNLDALEARVTLDLYQVKLRSFLISLQISVQMGTSMAAGIAHEMHTSAESTTTTSIRELERKPSG